MARLVTDLSSIGICMQIHTSSGLPKSDNETGNGCKIILAIEMKVKCPL